MVGFVQNDVVFAAGKAGDNAQIDLETSGENDGLILADKLSQPVFQFFVDVERTVQETGTGTAGAVFADCLDGSFLDLGVIGQAQVTVGTEHQDFFAVDDDFAVLLTGNGPEVRVYAKLHHFLRLVIFPKFFL